MRYLVAIWAILALLILGIHLISGADDDTVREVPSGGSDARVRDTRVGAPRGNEPTGLVVSATPTPTPASTPTSAPAPMPPLPNPAPAPAPITVGCTTEIICAYPWDCATAMRVVDCETGGTFSPFVVGAEEEKGCFQIHPVHWGKSYCQPDLLFDPAYNAECAWQINAVEGQGWWPWSCY